MTKLKLAPNMKKQAKEPYHVKLLAGSQAWDFANIPLDIITQGEKELDKLLPAGGDKPPIILTDEVLEHLSSYRIAPKNVMSITIQRANNGEKLKSDTITGICLNLSEHTTAKQVLLVDEAGVLLEDLSDYINRLRTNESEKEFALIFTESEEEFNERFQRLGVNGRVLEFLKWFSKPLRVHPDSDEFYCYTGKKWELLEHKKLKRLISEFFREKQVKRYSAATIESLVTLMSSELPETAKRSPELLAFNNGVLNKQTDELMPHSEQFFLTSLIEADYVRTPQPTPHFDKWLSFVSFGDEARKRTILAGLYMVLTNSYHWQLFIEATGVGGSGKSTYSEIAKMLAGEENSVAISIKNLEDDKKRCIIINKTLIISADQERFIGDGAIIKAITGGDSIDFDPKYKTGFSSPVYAVYMMTNNSPILFTEHNDGIGRRRVLFHFSRKVPDSEKDPTLLAKIEPEIGGVIRLLFDTFPNAEEARKLLLAQRDSKEALEIKLELDPILNFARHFETQPISNGLSVGQGGVGVETAKNSSIYGAYLYFCELNNTPINRRLERAPFVRRFKQALKELDNAYDYQTRQSNGRTVTNVYFKHKEATFQEWQG